MNTAHFKFTIPVAAGMALLMLSPATAQPPGEEGGGRNRRENRQERRAERNAGGQGQGQGQGQGGQNRGGGGGQNRQAPTFSAPSQSGGGGGQGRNRPSSVSDSPFSVAPGSSGGQSRTQQGVQSGRGGQGQNQNSQNEERQKAAREAAESARQRQQQKAAEDAAARKQQQAQKAEQEEARKAAQDAARKQQQEVKEREKLLEQQQRDARRQADDNKPGQKPGQGRGQGQNTGRGATEAGSAAAKAEQTPYVPSGTPPGGEDLNKRQQNRLDRNTRQAEKKEENQAEKAEQQAAREAKKAEQDAAQAAKKAEQDAQREAKQAEQATKKAEQDAAQAAKKAEQEAQRDANKAEREQKQAEKKGLATPAAGATAAGSPDVVDTSAANAAADPTRRERRQEKKEAKEAEKSIREAAKDLEKASKQKGFNPHRLSGAEKASLVGANALSPREARQLKKAAVLSAGDDLTYIKNLKIVNKKVTNNTIINQINMGNIPRGYGGGYWGDFGRVRRPAWDIGIGIGSGFFLPPPAPIAHGGFNFNLSWNYWDGRSYYDHGYASSLFVSLGHVRYGGCDGAIVSGRYYSYGYGYIDGCIDYGHRRIWVPGFYAPYTVEECGNVPIWIPPVYESVWTGCCWETVQVDGGYFGPGYSECHLVTRYTWVPGHFQYYWA